MLSVWKTGGRHNYNNATYDKMVADASVITDDPAARSKAMKDAEKMLVKNAPGAFLYHPLAGQLHKPYRKGLPRRSPTRRLHRHLLGRVRAPDDALNDTLYQSKDVERCARPSLRRIREGDRRLGRAPSPLPAPQDRIPRMAHPADPTTRQHPTRWCRSSMSAACDASFFTRRGEVHAVRDVSFSVHQGETLALVGESGSGQDRHRDVHPADAARQRPDPGGEIVFNGEDLLRPAERQMARIRGRQIGLIPQDPSASLNPLMTVGDHLTELLGVHLRLARTCRPQPERRAARGGRHPGAASGGSTRTHTSCRVGCASAS